MKPYLYPRDPEVARRIVCRWYYRPTRIMEGRAGHPSAPYNYTGLGFNTHAPVPASQEKTSS